MPGQARLDAPGVLHHVMVRGIEGSPIFLEDQDRQDFVTSPRMFRNDSVVSRNNKITCA
jgi:hypothetical protein